MTDILDIDSNGSYEENYLGYEIYIEENRDPNRGGFEWSICKNDTEIDSGLSFIDQEALKEARETINCLTKQI